MDGTVSCALSVRCVGVAWSHWPRVLHTGWATA